MKKPFVKQIILGTMALTLVVGGGYLMKAQDAFAATPVPTTAPAQAVSPTQDNHAFDMVRKVNDELIAFLKLDKTTYQTKITSGKTLAEIAKEQGISRADLKAELTKEMTAHLEKEKADFATNLDTTIDTIRPKNRDGFGPDGRHGGEYGGPDGEHIKPDLTNIATALGYKTVTELNTALGSDKSIADLAATKNVTTQSLIDLQVKAITATLDKNLASATITQAEYDKQKADVTKFATKMINDKHDGKGGPGGHGGKGGPGEHGGKGGPGEHGGRGGFGGGQDGGNRQAPDDQLPSTSATPTATPTATSAT